VLTEFGALIVLLPKVVVVVLVVVYPPWVIYGLCNIFVP
jgi:hypothetical protein